MLHLRDLRGAFGADAGIGGMSPKHSWAGGPDSPSLPSLMPGPAPGRQRYAAAAASAARADARPGTPPAAANDGWAMFR